MSINDWVEKIKLFIKSDTGRDVYLVLVIILVASASFGLGRLSKTTEIKEPVEITQINEENREVRTGNIFASKNGTKYYLPGCSSRVNEENKIFFATEAEAQAFGYSKSATCKQ